MTPSEIEKLIAEGLPTHPWGNVVLEHDFILLSEFSELDGPKPLLTIPSNLKTDFDLNAFAVRIMSADCASIMQTTEFSEFNIPGDIQVVLTELSEGAVAYVHHFVLYDIGARGYVRPFCLAYIMHDYSELLSVIDQIMRYFSTVSLLFHFGNTITFFHDIVTRLQYLKRLKAVIDEESFELYVDDQLLAMSQRNSVTDTAIDDQVKQLLLVKKSFAEYLEKDIFQDHRNLFNEKYLEALENEKECDRLFREPSQANVRMSGESSLHNHNQSGRSSSDSSSPKEGYHTPTEHGSPSHNDGGISFLAEGHIKNMGHDDEILIDATDDNISVYSFPTDVISSIIGKKYDKLLRSINSLCSVTFHTAFDILKFCLYQLNNKGYDDENIELEDENIYKFGFLGKKFPILTMPANEQNSNCNHTKLSLKLTPLSLEIFAPGTNSHSLINDSGVISDRSTSRQTIQMSSSFSNFKKASFFSTATYLPKYSTSPKYLADTKETKDGYVLLDSPTGNKSLENSSGSTNSLKFQSVTSSSVLSFSTISVCDTMYTVYGRSISPTIEINKFDTSQEGLLSDVNLMKVKLSSLHKKFSFLPELLFSIFVNRPIIILADEKRVKNVKRLVYGLANFIPQNQYIKKKAFTWLTRQLQLKDLYNLAICGLTKSQKNPVPFSIKPYVSIFDYENQTLIAPPYEGKFLREICKVRKHFSNEGLCRMFIQQMLSELLAVVYVRFNILHMQKGKVHMNNYQGQGVFSCMLTSQGLLTPGDSKILHELTNLMKDMILAKEFQQIAVVDEPSKFVRLNLLRCDLFQNTFKKKKSAF